MAQRSRCGDVWTCRKQHSEAGVAMCCMVPVRIAERSEPAWCKSQLGPAQQASQCSAQPCGGLRRKAQQSKAGEVEWIVSERSKAMTSMAGVAQLSMAKIAGHGGAQQAARSMAWLSGPDRREAKHSRQSAIDIAPCSGADQSTAGNAVPRTAWRHRAPHCLAKQAKRALVVRSNARQGSAKQALHCGAKLAHRQPGPAKQAVRSGPVHGGAKQSAAKQAKLCLMVPGKVQRSRLCRPAQSLGAQSQAGMAWRSLAVQSDPKQSEAKQQQAKRAWPGVAWPGAAQRSKAWPGMAGEARGCEGCLAQFKRSTAGQAKRRLVLVVKWSKAQQGRHCVTVPGGVVPGGVQPGVAQ